MKWLLIALLLCLKTIFAQAEVEGYLLVPSQEIVNTSDEKIRDDLEVAIRTIKLLVDNLELILEDDRYDSMLSSQYHNKDEAIAAFTRINLPLRRIDKLFNTTAIDESVEKDIYNYIRIIRENLDRFYQEDYDSMFYRFIDDRLKAHNERKRRHIHNQKRKAASFEEQNAGFQDIDTEIKNVVQVSK